MTPDTVAIVNKALDALEATMQFRVDRFKMEHNMQRNPEPVPNSVYRNLELIKAARAEVAAAATKGDTQ